MADTFTGLSDIDLNMKKKVGDRSFYAWEPFYFERKTI